MWGGKVYGPDASKTSVRKSYHWHSNLVLHKRVSTLVLTEMGMGGDGDLEGVCVVIAFVFS
jgi:hypothetical protein